MPSRQALATVCILYVISNLPPRLIKQQASKSDKLGASASYCFSVKPDTGVNHGIEYV